MFVLFLVFVFVCLFVCFFHTHNCLFVCICHRHVYICLMTIQLLLLIPPYIRMLSSDWLMKGVFFFNNSSFFQLLHHCRDICLKISRYYRKIYRSRRNPFFKQFMTSRILFELLGFILSTNAKVKKMTTVSAVMFEIVEMYIFQIHLH